MRKLLDIYFGFKRKEVDGLLVLIGLIGLIIITPYIYGLLKQPEPITRMEEEAVLKLALAEKEKVLKRGDSRQRSKYTAKNKVNLFFFDPNQIGQEDWEQLGLSARQASAILKYLERGGRFSKKEDLQKMYTISPETYRSLAPYVKIPDADVKQGSYEPKIYKTKAAEKTKPVMIELNSADTTQLDQIKGIGMAFANRIIKYRERIGGFHKKEQLMEVFGLDAVKYEEIKEQIEIDASRIRKININTATVEDFKNHPYIRYKQVNALIQYRKQHGNYSNIADLNKVVILNQETIDRLAAYLEF